MRNRLERRRLTLRAAALCIVLVLLCGCLLPAFAEGPERTDSVPDQTWDEEIEDEPAWDEEEDIRTDEPVLLPAEGGIPAVADGLDDIGLPDETPTPDSGAVKADEHFERTYLFWLSESDEADGGLPYAEQTVGSGEELMSRVYLTKNYELANTGTISPKETFTFTIDPGTVTDASEGIDAADYMPSVGDVSYAQGEAGSANKTRQIEIQLPKYDSVGVYTYIIHEVAGNSAGVTYYGDAILLRVTVIEQDGKLRIAAVHTEDPESTGEGKKDDFDNLYSAGELEVHKDVEGIMGNKDKYFEFTVQLTGEEGKTYQDSYAITGGSYDANPASIEIKPGETTEATFYLKDGDTIHIENLPYGVEYKVSETPVADYVTTETGTEGEVDEAVEQANFTNTKGGTVDAGVVLDSAPYLFTLTGAAGVGLLLTLRRRHQK